jgi:hypothetical protein
MYAMNIQNDVIGLVLRENCKSKQVTDFIAWPSRCHGRIYSILSMFVRCMSIGEDFISLFYMFYSFFIMVYVIFDNKISLE